MERIQRHGALVLHQEPNTVMRNDLISQLLATDHRTVYTQERKMQVMHLHGRLHNQELNLSAPITGENKRIVEFVFFQQKHQSCESIEVKS